ncbi:MAG TPA: ATP-binding protein [Flavobacterium sp.]|uniref:ATP-binding protein n=1 Tax=Flavobacterium sp. TaxID=239 RepID=UPI002DB57021|nr:ATP-binding protein [Flavobacterium sp.]HEU4791124.1 ATP-binding protein [Flavobacterium sp.]
MKIYPLIVLVIVISIGSLHAQESINRYNFEADSVQRLLVKHRVNDEQKVIWLNEFARLSFQGLEFKKGLIATKQARELSKKLHYKNGEVQYYLTMADLHGFSYFSFYYSTKADWLSTEEEKKENIRILHSKKFTLPNVEQLQKSLVQLTIALPYFEKEKDKEMQANIGALLAGGYSIMGRAKESVAASAKALPLFKELKQTFPVFQVSSYMMTGLINEGKQEEAQKIEIELVKIILTIKDKKLIALLSLPLGEYYSNSGRPSLAIEYYLKSVSVLEEDLSTGDKDILVHIYRSIANNYGGMGKGSKNLEYFLKTVKLLKKMNDTVHIYDVYGSMVFTLIGLKRYDEARKYMALALQDPRKEIAPWLLAKNYDAKGQIEMSRSNYRTAISFFNKSLGLFLKSTKIEAPFIYSHLMNCYEKVNDLPKAIENGLLAYSTSKTYNTKGIELQSSLSLSRFYEQRGQKEKALKYLKIYQQLKDAFDNLDTSNYLANVEIQSVLEKSKHEIEKLEKRRLEKEAENKNQRLWIFSITGALISALVVMLLLYRNNQHKQKANALLLQQKKEINKQRKIAEKALNELKNTQNQLIQSEKMASLGELTAGIAHEIQNPLNFVNNFSEVSNELIKEIQEERSKSNGEKNEELVGEILDDISKNLEKINYHGKRADGIVKGMLQHSRISSGQKEPTNINKLADEYLRLAYYGLRAKDKSFNADLVTDFDENLPKINVLTQEIGRALLNLFTNAFYATHQKKKKLGETYKPMVSLKTVLNDNGIEITVKDNGVGIPEAIKDKIMQPFFTTKPTGEGTGLGLSLSYDIVVKAHSGTIKIESEEGEGATFIVLLPLNI